MEEKDALKEIYKALQDQRRNSPQWYDDTIHAAATICAESGKFMQAIFDYTYNEKNIREPIERAASIAALVIRFMVNIPEQYLPNKFTHRIDGK